MRDFFKYYHPLVNFLFFASILFYTMFVRHPFVQVISLLGGISYCLILKGWRGVRGLFTAMAFSLLLIVGTNPILNHQGVTILFYLWDNNPVTLESILFGFSAGIMFISTILWFTCHNEIMTSDRLMYLFGKLSPSVSLIFSMVLRFVPMYKEKIKEISFSRSCIGRDPSKGTIFSRIKKGLSIFSIFVSWALEGSIETSNSMRSRGFGLRGRTAFSLFVWERKDRILFCFLVFLDVFLLFGLKNRYFKMVYYPALKIAKWHCGNYFALFIFFLLAFFPSFLSIKEEVKWKYYL